MDVYLCSSRVLGEAELLVPAVRMLVRRMLARTALPSMLLSITSDLLTGESPVYLDTDTLTIQPQKQWWQGIDLLELLLHPDMYIFIYLYEIIKGKNCFGSSTMLTVDRQHNCSLSSKLKLILFFLQPFCPTSGTLWDLQLRWAVLTWVVALHRKVFTGR